MMTSKDRIIDLLNNLDKADPDAQKLDEFVRMINDPAQANQVKEVVAQMISQQEMLAEPSVIEDMWSTVSRNLDEPAPVVAMHRVHFLKTAWFRYAAAVLIVLSVGGYFWFTNKKTVDITPVAIAAKDGIKLTLGNGTVLILDSLGNGSIGSEDGATINLANNQLAYHPSGKKDFVTGYNTMTTPRGRQFMVILSDGTKAWLNSASSIRYPTMFNGNERKVEITGEVYFEVAKNTAKPFLVSTNNKVEIQVLGTNFNVNTYENEPLIKTSLLSGSVRVNYATTSQVLQPGEQAQIIKGERIKVVKNADMDKVMAWKNGYFNFNDADIYEVMRQLERWYDIEVVYAKPVRPVAFNGELQRDLSYEQILKVLKEMRVNFKTEGRKLIIEP